MPPIIILDTNKALSKRFLSILKKEDEFRVLEVFLDFRQIEDTVFRQKADIVIAKVKGLQDLHGVIALIGKRKDWKVIVIGDLNEDIAFEYIKSGVKGVLNCNSSPGLLKKAVRVIHKGEVWYDRKTSSKVFEEFAARHAAERRQHKTIESLSNKEKEVLHLVSKQGYSQNPFY